MATATAPKPVYGPLVVTPITEGPHAGKFQTGLASFQKFHPAIHAVMTAEKIDGASATKPVPAHQWDKALRGYISSTEPSRALLDAVHLKIDFANAEAALADRVLVNRAAFGPLARPLPYKTGKDQAVAEMGTRREGNAIVVKYPEYAAANKIITGLKTSGVDVTFNSYDKTYRIVVSDPARVEHVADGLLHAGDKIATRTFSNDQAKAFENPSSIVHVAHNRDRGILVLDFQQDSVANKIATDAGATYIRDGKYGISIPTPQAAAKARDALISIDSHFSTNYLVPPGPHATNGRGVEGLARPSEAIEALLAADPKDRLATLTAQPDEKLANELKSYNRDIVDVLDQRPELATAVAAGDISGLTGLGLTEDTASTVIHLHASAAETLDQLHVAQVEQLGLAATQDQSQSMAM